MPIDENVEQMTAEQWSETILDLLGLKGSVEDYGDGELVKALRDRLARDPEGNHVWAWRTEEEEWFCRRCNARLPPDNAEILCSGGLSTWEDLAKEVLSDPDAHAAYVENELRCRLGSAVDKARKQRGLSIQKLAKLIGTSASQVKRLLHIDLGGSLTLRMLCRAADALGLQVRIHVSEEPQGQILDVPKGLIVEDRSDVWRVYLDIDERREHPLGEGWRTKEAAETFARVLGQSVQRACSKDTLPPQTKGLNTGGLWLSTEQADALARWANSTVTTGYGPTFTAAFEVATAVAAAQQAEDYVPPGTI